MAQSGYTPIVLYTSTTPGVVPTAGNLVTGELGLNAADGKLFYKNSATSTVTTLAGLSGYSGYSGGTGTNGTSGYSGYSGFGGTTLSTTDFTATAGQTVFTVTYSPSLLQGVYRNGVKLGQADYTATNGTSITLNTGAVTGDLIQVQSFVSSSVVGTSGYSGYSGTNGTNGTSGYSGYSGTNGTNGTSGYSGYSGTNGTNGASGTSGYSGTNGTNGASGTSGYSGSGISGFSGYSGSAATASIPTGSVLLFYQSAAPTGWTQVTSLNDYSLRLVSGTGGTTGGTTAFSTVFTNQTPSINVSGLSAGATTLSTTQMPSHYHSNGAKSCGTGGYTSCGFASPSIINTGSTGGGGSHTHSISGSASSSAITLNVQYANVIICSKN
jgi:hypothetical protein